MDSLFCGISRSKLFQIINKRTYKYIIQDLQLYRNYLSDRTVDLDEGEPEPDEIILKPTIQNQLQQPAPSKQIETGKYDEGLLDAAKTIISTNFVNGMRKNAVIAKKKFKKAYLELTGIELPESIDIDDLAADIGFEYSEKIYAISEESNVIFYEDLYKQNADFMTKAGIFSSDLLKIVLKQILPEFCYKRASFSEHESDTLDLDIEACYDDRLLLSYDEMKSLLPYADMAQIRLVCSRNSRFVWAKEETYALVEKLHLSEADIDESKHVIADDIINILLDILHVF